MSIQTYRITMRVDVGQDGADAVTEIVRQFATQLQSTAVLVTSGRYQPEVSATRTNGVFAVEDIDLHADRRDAAFEDGAPE